MAKLTDAQIVAAILSCKTNREAAKSLNISETQLYERMQSESYRDLLNCTVSAQLEGIAGNLRDKLTAAVSVLSEVAEDKDTPASIRVAACNSLITHFCTLSKVARTARQTVKSDREEDLWDRFSIL